MTPEIARTTAIHLFAPEEATRRARPLAIDYFLKNKANQVTVEILDAQGKIIQSFVGPEPKKEQEEPDNPFQPPPAKVGLEAGLNRFVWDLRYPGPTKFPGMIFWSAPTNGPLALPGSYQVRVTAGGESRTKPFKISLDPRMKTTQAELQEQFDLAIKVRDRVSEANEGVIAVRKVRDQINDRLEKTKFAERDTARKPMTDALERLRAKLTEVEEAVYQVRNRSGQDPLNYPIKLNNKIAHLAYVIESADAKPTDQTYAAFKELSGELQAELEALNKSMTTDVPAVNKLLERKKITPISR